MGANCHNMNLPKTCKQCGTVIPSSRSRRLCPACLFDTALSAEGDWPLKLELNNATPAANSTSTFGEYELLGELGRGGQGIVYRARHRSLRRIVALKTIPPNHLADDQARARFVLEASTASRLDHPNLVPIYEVGERDGFCFFTMKLIEGASIERLVVDGPPDAAACRHVATILGKVAQGVNHAHQRGILHRDLKPSNVLLGHEDEPHVTDFGMAREMGEASELTVTHGWIGTPAYLAPEVIAGGSSQATIATDIYGLGAILYHVLTARAPFSRTTLAATLHAAQTEDVPSPSCINRAVPVDLETVCLKCLEKDPAQRYPSAEALAEELNRFLRGEPVHALPVSRLEKTARWCRRKPALASSLFLILILILILIIGSPIAIYRINRARQTAELNLYAADMSLASQALENHNIRRTRELLEKHSPFVVRASAGSSNENLPRGDRLKAGLLTKVADLRGWEWRYLYGQCKSDELSTLLRGTSPVSTVCFSPDGAMLFAAVDDGTIRVWDFTSRRELAPFQTFSGKFDLDPLDPNHAVAVSPDGCLLAAGGPNKGIVIWELPSRRKLATLTGHTKTIRHLDFTSDSLTLASASKDGTIRLWEMRTNSFQQIALLKHGSEAFRGAFSPDHQIIATSGKDRYVRFWDLSARALPREVPPAIERDGWVVSLAFAPDGKLLATSAGGLVPLWDTTTHIQAASLEASSSAIHDVAFCGDGRKVAAAAHDLNICVWDRNRPSDRLTLQGHEGEIFSVSFSKDGNILASGSRDGTVKLWDVSSFEPRGTSWPFKDFINQVVFSPNGKFLAGACAGDRDQVKLWDSEGNREISKATLPQPAGIFGASFSEDSSMLAIRGQGSWLLGIPSLEIITNFPASTVTFSPKGNFLVLVRDQQVIRHDPNSGAEIVLGALAQGNGVNSIISPDGNTAAIAAYDRGLIITLWDTSKPGPPIVLRGLTEPSIRGLAFSPDSHLLASHEFYGRVGLWNAQNGRRIALFHPHAGGAWAIAFAPDGNTLLSSADDGTIRFWNLATLQEAGSIHGDRGAISALAFSPDGNHLASGGNRRVRIWDAPSFQEIDQNKQPTK
jgi:WD40 repeat protein